MRFLYSPQNMAKNKNCSTERMFAKECDIEHNSWKFFPCYLHPEIETRRHPALPCLDSTNSGGNVLVSEMFRKSLVDFCQFVVRSPSIGNIRNDEKILTASATVAAPPFRPGTSQTSSVRLRSSSRGASTRIHRFFEVAVKYFDLWRLALIDNDQTLRIITTKYQLPPHSSSSSKRTFAAWIFVVVDR